MIKYDPVSGALQRTATPIGSRATVLDGRTTTLQRVIAGLISPAAPPRFYIQPGTSYAVHELKIHTPPRGLNTRPLEVAPGIGLLPFVPGTHEQYQPQPCPFAAQVWGERDICTQTGRVGYLKNQNTTHIRLQHPSESGAITHTTLYRAQLVAAAHLGLHPLTPVMAWYKHDPEIFGYGIDNVFTPTAAGFVQYDPEPVDGVTCFRFHEGMP